MKNMLLVFFLLGCNFSFSQMSWKKVLKGSESYYLNKNSGIIELQTTSKNILKADTNYSTQKFLFFKAASNLAKLISNDNASFTLFEGKSSYGVNREKNNYYLSTNLSEGLLRPLPYWNTESFFKEYYNFGRWFSPKIEEADSLFLLSFSNRVDRQSILYIYKSDFRLQKFVDIITNRRGSQYKEYEFFEIGTLFSADTLVKEIKFITTSFKRVTDKELDNEDYEYEKRKERLIGSKINRESLEEILSRQNQSGISGRYILIDFFYQGCRPCVKGIPDLNRLRERFDSILTIAGLDIVSSDVGHKQSFIDKFKISYTVVDGNEAVKARELMPEIRLFYPTMVLISPEGKIIKIMDGYSKDHFKWVEEYLGHL